MKYPVGSRVRIIDGYRSAYRKYSLEGKEGFVLIDKSLTNDLGIIVIGEKNPNSKYGYFWLPEYCVELVSEHNSLKEEDDMKELLRGYNRIAVVKLGVKGYYYALYDKYMEYKEGDKVVVSGKYKNIVEIESIIESSQVVDLYPITEEVICKLDFSAYSERCKVRERAKELKDKMDQKIKELDEFSKYEMYAKNDPELYNMLSELRSLNV